MCQTIADAFLSRNPHLIVSCTHGAAVDLPINV